MPVDTVRVGNWVMVIDKVVEPVHPKLVPEIVYVVLVVGFADTMAPVLGLSPVVGDHE